MAKRMAAIAAVYVLVSIAWFVLAGSVAIRTERADHGLREEVAALWGSTQEQVSPQLHLEWEEDVEQRELVTDPTGGQKRVVTRIERGKRSEPAMLERSDLAVDLRLDQRRKGLLWYATYGVDFRGDYVYRHDVEREATLVITWRFPTTQALYDGFRFEVDGSRETKVIPIDDPQGRAMQHRRPVRPGDEVPFAIAYRSQGLDWWRYSFGQDVTRVKNFDLLLKTDFKAIDFSAGTISPMAKRETAEGWELQWQSENLISGFDIGVDMPRRLNPGPLASRIAFFAPVCLGFFFVWMFVIGLLRGIELHPMNYLFLGAAFFAFHLLFAYTVDHLDVLPAFVICSVVSVFLVVSYLRLVAGLRFAALEAAGSQLIYLVLFSYAHFFEGFTGLIVTVGSILTLFLLMQLTGRFRWDQRLSPRPGGQPAAAGV